MIWHSTEISDVLENLNTSESTGLANGVAEERLQAYGKNVVTATNSPSFTKRLREQFCNKVVYILIAVALVCLGLNIVYGNESFSGGEVFSPLLIIAIVIANAIISAYHLYSSDKAMCHLSTITNPNATVIREGAEKTIPSSELVPGDIVILNSGDYITADARIITTDNAFRCSEAALSGETIPVTKDENLILEDITPITQRGNMVFSGCSVIGGYAKAVVVATGADTEAGHTSAIINQSGSENLPIKSTLDATGRITNIIVLLSCVLVFTISLIQNFRTDVPFASMTAGIALNTIALAVAAIPESLPAISTVVLSLGIRRILKDGIILKKVRAIENLGRTSIICSDKTGIITHNRMSVESVYDGNTLISKDDLPTSDVAKLIIRFAATCSTLQNDSTEECLQQACLEYNALSKSDLENLTPRLGTIPFDTERKTMTTVNMINGQTYAIVKGAPEILLSKCTDCNFEKIKEVNDTLANDSIRVVCIAIKKLESVPAMPTANEIECDLTFIGLIGLYDPPRANTVEGIATCQNAGINTIMITGDSLLTAKAVARRIGILKDGTFAITGSELNEIDDTELERIIEKYTVFARITPEDKLRIISALQKCGHIVTVTGDDIGDADSLAAADVGCAMGDLGADVAKGNADIILSNNNFSSIVEAIKDSRGLFFNIHKSVFYLLACNFGELLCYLLSLLIFKTPPVSAVQLLWLNLLTDCAPIFSLSCDTPQNDVMDKKPITLFGKLFDSYSLISIAVYAVYIALITVCSFLIGLHISLSVAMTMAFTTLGIAEILHSVICKSQQSLLKLKINTNSFMFLSTIVSLFVILFLAVTPIGSLFGLCVLNTSQIIYSLLLSVSIIPFSEFYKLIVNKK